MLVRYRGSLLIILALWLVSACSGGGGASEQPKTPKQQNSGEWNQMVWDQDRWQ